MVFSSIIFLYLYLPITLTIYMIIPSKWRNIWLFIVNLVFYGWGEPVYLLVMLCSILLNYLSGMMVGRWRERKQKQAKMVLAITVILNLGILIYFKYMNFFMENLAKIPLLHKWKPLKVTLPIGISFYTFQAMSYPVDVYRGKADSQRSILKFGTYVAMFPQLIAGPIVRYTDIAGELDKRTLSGSRMARGVRRFVIGLGKKVLLANNIGQLWDIYASLPKGQLTVAGTWIGALAYTFQIYFDFSGYSDMAIGLGDILGFTFPENFNYPYISKSITEFWRRWHMTLGTWFRDYVYIPLGGNRRGFARQVVNLWIVWGLTGLWHGASWNFLIWGMYYGLLIMMEKGFLLSVLEKCPGFIRHIYTMLLVVIGWVFFAIDDSGRLTAYLKTMCGVNDHPFLSGTDRYYLRNFAVVLVLVSAGALPVVKKAFQHLDETCRHVVATAVIAVIMVICTAYLVDSTYNPFLYFRF